nr:hypothetical protein [Desulfobacula sp.]
MIVKEKTHPGNEIKIWLLRHGIKQSDINKALGYKLSGGAVCHLLRGVSYPKRIVKYLESIGCPERLLADLKIYYLKRQKLVKTK